MVDAARVVAKRTKHFSHSTTPVAMGRLTGCRSQRKAELGVGAVMSTPISSGEDGPLMGIVFFASTATLLRDTVSHVRIKPQHGLGRMQTLWLA